MVGQNGYRALVLLAVGLVLGAVSSAQALPLPQADEVMQEVGAFTYEGEWDNDARSSTAVVTQTGAYLQAGYGVAEGWEAYVRIGAADLLVEKLFGDQKTDFEGDYRPFGTVGVRGNLLNGRYFSLGAFVDGSYFSDVSDDRTVILSADIFPPALTTVPAREELTFTKHWAANLGLNGELKLGGVSLYAGPLIYWRQAEIEGRITLAGDTFSSAIGSVNENGQVGLVGGVNLPLGSLGYLRLEVQQRSALSLAAAYSYLQIKF